jgi:ATP-dependent protease ClpP protease subunit
MTGHIFIYGPIGTEKGEISLKNIQNQIDPNVNEYELHFRSEGGDVDEGFAIYNYLNELKKKGKKIPRAINESLCASISTLIADVADEIIMMEKSQFMIHNPKITQLAQPSDAKNLRAIANRLDGIKTLLISGYQKRTGLTTDKLWELYDNETWLNPSQAVELGFASAVEPALKAVAKINLTETVKMEKKHANLFDRLVNLFKTVKVENEMAETLEDGRVIVVLTDTEDWTGKQVMLQDGGPLEPGTYTLTTGKTFTVGDQGTITEVKEPEVQNKEEETKNEDMEKDKKIAELEAQLAALKSEKETAEANAAKAEAKTVKVENRVKAIEADFLKLKEEMEKSYGDTTPPGKGPVNKMNVPAIENYDPMGEEAMKILKGHNRI